MALFWGIGILVGLIVFYKCIKGLTGLYVRVPPDQAAYFFGKGRGKAKTIKIKQPDHPDGPVVQILPPGTKVVSGGGKFRIPVFEEVKILDLRLISLPAINVVNMPSKEGVLVSVEAVANIKFRNEPASLLAAGARFLDTKREQIENVAHETLEANLRGVVGRLTIEELIHERHSFRNEVMKEAGEDLQRFGMEIDQFNPKTITDEQSYITSLGKKRTAEVQRDAMIGEAAASAEAKKRSTDESRGAEIVAQENIRLEEEAKKNKNVSIQIYSAEIAKEQAISEQAGPLSTAEERQKVVAAEIQVEEARIKAEIEVEKQRIEKQRKAQEAVVVVPAKAAADAEVRKAEGYKQAETAKAEGDKFATIARADAMSHKTSVEGRGKALAIKAQGVAEAEVILQKGLAHAEALEKAAEAYSKFGTEALILEMMKEAPDVIRSLAPVFEGMTSHMGNIDRLTVYDSGASRGNGDGGGNSLIRLGNIAPDLIFDLVTSLSARGIDISDLAKKAGIDVSKYQRADEALVKEKA